MKSDIDRPYLVQLRSAMLLAPWLLVIAVSGVAALQGVHETLRQTFAAYSGKYPVGSDADLVPQHCGSPSGCIVDGQHGGAGHHGYGMKPGVGWRKDFASSLPRRPNGTIKFVAG